MVVNKFKRTEREAIGRGGFKGGSKGVEEASFVAPLFP